MMHQLPHVSGLPTTLDADTYTGKLHGNNNNTIELLSIDEISTVLGFLSWREILLARVSKKFKAAATLTPVPLTNNHDTTQGFNEPEYCVDSRRAYTALAWMVRALPKLQQISFINTNDMPFFEDGNNPDTSMYTQHEDGSGSSRQSAQQISIISNFGHLRSLKLHDIALNGYYPCLVGFPHLQKLHINGCWKLKTDLEMLSSSCTVLEQLILIQLPLLRGDVKHLRGNKDTLRQLCIRNCAGVHGDFMEMADFPLLKTLNLESTSVCGDWRRMKDECFPVLQYISLPAGVYGGTAREFEHIDDVPEVMNVLCSLRKRNGTVTIEDRKRWKLSRDSPDQYPVDIFSLLQPPFQIEIVEAGPRVGWRWTNGLRWGCCEANWYNDEPCEEDSNYEAYQVELKAVEKYVRSYRGYFKPPTEEEYQRMSTHW